MQTGATQTAAPRTMILLDPDLDPDPAPLSKTVKRAIVSSAPAKSPDFHLPTARTLGRFLTRAQAAVRLRGQVTILLTTDAAIRDLNRRFRGKNKATDVLSFPVDTTTPGPEKIAGDLAISVSTALRQAAGQGHSLSTEIKVLVLHGLLHLAGYDHEADSGQMERRERLLRGRLGLPQGLIERAETPKQQAPSKAAALKGHGLSRAKKGTKRIAALAAEGMQAEKKAVPQGLKPKINNARLVAQLRPRPFKTEGKTNHAAKARRP